MIKLPVKMQSRKLWVLLLTVVLQALIIILQGGDLSLEEVIGMIGMSGTSGAYIIGQSMVDKEKEKDKQV